jgi:colanic acid/amylovoran biosynthesis protein
MKIGLGGFYRRKLMKRIQECDVVISGSDENFKEAASLLPTNLIWKLTWLSILFVRTMEMVVVKYLGKPTILFPNSVGPFRSGFGKYLANTVFNSFDYIIIREPVSWDILQSLNIDRPKKLTSDAALLFKPRGQPPKDLTTKPTLCICPGVYNQALSDEELDNYIYAHSYAADYAVKEFDLDVVFMPHFITGFEMDDLGISKIIHERMEKKDRASITVVEDLDEFKYRINNMTMVISSKMHPAVLGVSGFVPTLCVAYDHKQIGFFNNLEMPECLVEIGNISSEALVDILDHIWSNKESIRTELNVKIPELQKIIRNTMEESLFSLLEKTSE